MPILMSLLGAQRSCVFAYFFVSFPLRTEDTIFIVETTVLRFIGLKSLGDVRPVAYVREALRPTTLTDRCSFA